MNIKYYAEFETDKILRELYFSDFNYKGTIIEVGGATPDFLSMSKHFKDFGWRTIIIEPNPHFVELHKKHNNEVYEIACSNKESDSQDFTIVELNVNGYGGIITHHSFSGLEIKPEYSKNTNFKIDGNNTKQIKVKVRKLDTLISELNLNKIDLVTIDVEGWELEVMEGFVLNKNKCKYVLLENLFHDDNYNQFMKNYGFKLINKIEYNYLYLNEHCNW